MPMLCATGYDGSERKDGFMIQEGHYTILENRGAVAKITINRPEKRNTLSRAAIPARCWRCLRSYVRTMISPWC